MRRPLTTATLCLAIAHAAMAQSDPFIDDVVSFTPGMFAGFGADALPEVVLGPPRGGGERQGSADVVSLGHGGSITLRFDAPLLCDGDGPDFTIFENAFLAGTAVFDEIAYVEVSRDGVEFVRFPFDPETFVGGAGRTPVLSHPDNDIDPTDPSVSGGDTFDLQDVGLDRVAYIRIIDAAEEVDDAGNAVSPGTSGGFDLDAIAALHPCGDTVPATPTGTLVPTPTQMPIPIEVGDLDGDGDVDETDFALIAREIFDGDGILAIDAGGGDIATGLVADVQGDGIIDAADIVAMQALRR